MIDIAKKKLPHYLVSALVYLSYCAMSLYIMRGSMAYYGELYGFAGWFTNDIWAFFLGGIIPAAIYMVVSSFMFRMLSLKVHGDVSSIKYGLSLTVIAANILLFALKFLYILFPVAAPAVNSVIDAFITLAAVALYLWYAFGQNYVDKTRYRVVVNDVMTTFAVIYGVYALANIISSVSMGVTL